MAALLLTRFDCGCAVQQLLKLGEKVSAEPSAQAQEPGVAQVELLAFDGVFLGHDDGFIAVAGEVALLEEVVVAEEVLGVVEIR